MSNKNKQSISVSYERTNNVPLDKTCVFDTFAEAFEYVCEENTTAYAGQLISIREDIENTYVITKSSESELNLDLYDYDVYYAMSLNYPDKLYVVPKGTEKVTSKDKLTSQFVHLPSTIKTIGANACEGDKLLSKYVVPTSVEKIETKAYMGANITELTIPPRVTQIDPQAFNISGLTSVIFTDKQDWLLSENEDMSDAFDLEDGLIDDPQRTAEALKSGSFYWRKGFSENIQNYEFEDTTDGVKITKYIGRQSNIKIPETLGGKTVVCIGTEAFKDSSINSVEIPANVTVIEEEAFANSSLRNVTFHSRNSALRCMNNAFVDCEAIEKVYTPNINQWLTYMYFHNSDANPLRGNLYINNNVVSEINIPYESIGWGVMSIRGFAFSGLSSTITVRIPLGVYDSYVHPDAFNANQSIIFEGSEQDWLAIAIGIYDDNPYTNVTFEGKRAIIKKGKYKIDGPVLNIPNILVDYGVDKALTVRTTIGSTGISPGITLDIDGTIKERICGIRQIVYYYPVMHNGLAHELFVTDSWDNRKADKDQNWKLIYQGIKGGPLGDVEPYWYGVKNFDIDIVRIFNTSKLFDIVVPTSFANWFQDATAEIQ